MDNSANETLEKYFQRAFVFIFFFVIAVFLYRQFIYLPQKQKEYVLRNTPRVVEERDYFTPEEDKEMRAVYAEIMLKKYGQKIDANGVAPIIVPIPTPATKKK